MRKLIKSLDNEFTKANLKVGRDALFSVLRKHNMLTLRKKTMLEQQTRIIVFISIIT